MGDVTQQVVRLAFPARAEYLILGRLALAGVARAVPIDDEVLADLKLAVTEACGNVVKHAYPAPDAAGPVRLAIEVEEGAITITVEDDGVGLPADTPTNGHGEAAESGMGLAIIAAIADEVQTGQAAGGGASLRFRKKL